MRFLAPVESFLSNSLHIASDHLKMKNIRYKNVLRNKTINASGILKRFLRVEGIREKMRRFLLVFCQIEMQSMTRRPG